MMSCFGSSWLVYAAAEPFWPALRSGGYARFRRGANLCVLLTLSDVLAHDAAFTELCACLELPWRSDPRAAARAISVRCLHTACQICVQATLKEMKASETMHEADRKKLEELQDVKQQYEERLMEIATVSEGLKEENDSLRADALMWKERADAYLSEKIALEGAAEDLRLQNGDLRSKVRCPCTHKTMRTCCSQQRTRLHRV